MISLRFTPWCGFICKRPKKVLKRGTICKNSRFRRSFCFVQFTTTAVNEYNCIVCVVWTGDSAYNFHSSLPVLVVSWSGVTDLDGDWDFTSLFDFLIVSLCVEWHIVSTIGIHFEVCLFKPRRIDFDRLGIRVWKTHRFYQGFERVDTCSSSYCFKFTSTYYVYPVESTLFLACDSSYRLYFDFDLRIAYNFVDK